ncbi:inositol 1,4,5-trisphosphate receptor-interacting protein-like 1 [Patagioenas fasciata monilis]|uniref:Inositol 1,4,5-trisphosphate receptor-interacting protein-like 1 n=1 Tax=Patagioenas fasciata monilis TaxID=372326 RepID=A0A1V4KAA0_PATFA|nr:inositol 1,4,5-trisphosphate receptor-interacting protein-like 1 [Patagioenas fasciata monilis]
MALLDIVFGILQILIHSVQLVGEELDEETRRRMELRAEMLQRETTRLWQEEEQMNQEQWSQESNGFTWAFLLLSALQHWQFWVVAGVLVLLFGLCWWLRKWSREPEREEQSSDSDVEEEEHEEENDSSNESEEEDDDANEPGMFFEEHIQWPVQHLDRDYQTVRDLMETFILVFQYLLSNACFPVLEKAIEVGSAFEGWSPREEDITYRLLLPLKPPSGHIFHLEPGPLWLTRNFRIRVELVCTCEMAQPAGQTRCFLHDPEQEQRRNAGPTILEDLCTDSYLDVQKTARYFQMFLRCSWRALPISAAHRLTVLPSDRSCKFCVTQRRGKRILIEFLFGVQEGDSDIFVSSQYTEAAYTPSTMWPESYAVAEMKFFRHIAIQAQPDTCHLRCLQICVRCLLGRDFYTYTLKTVVMHVLTTIPLSNWRGRHFWERLNDILQYLQSCLEKKQLNHFFIGNENVPEEIILPLELRMAEPLNLFQHLGQDPDAHEHAQLEFEELGNRVRRMVVHGR